MRKNQTSGLSASNVTNDPDGVAQSKKASTEGVDESFSSDLLNAGGRVVKGKLRKIDPKQVRRSRIANRSIDEEHPSHLNRLAELMRQAGTNTVPALVHEVSSVESESEYLYELVYGHRRHQVCLSESLPFTAIVVPNLDDVERAFLMAHENEGRVAPCPMDMAVWLLQLSTEGKFKNQAAVAQATNIKPASVTNLLKLARLPAEVITAFSSRSDIGHRHALPLEQAVKEDLNGLVKRAKAITALRSTAGAKINKQQVFAMLTGKLPIDATASKPGASESALSTRIDKSIHVAGREQIELGEVRDRNYDEGTRDAEFPDRASSPDGRFIQRFNKELPLVTNDGVDVGQVFAAPTEETLIRLRFSLNDHDLDWLASNLGDFLSGAPFLHNPGREEGDTDD